MNNEYIISSLDGKKIFSLMDYPHGSMILFGFIRYALERQRYVVEVAVETILREWGNLRVAEKDAIKREIRSAVKNHIVGDKADIIEWEKVLER